MDEFQFLNAVIYDGEVVDIEMEKPKELNILEFFIYDTKENSRAYERTWKLI